MAQVPDPGRSLPQPVDPAAARAAVRAHMAKALDGYAYDYDDDRTIFVRMLATAPDGTQDMYMIRLTFLYYPDWPPSVTFVNVETAKYDGTHWPRIAGSSTLALYPNYGDAPTGMVCNSMTFEYYFWGGHSPSDEIRWSKEKHTFAATIAELRDNLRQPYYQGKQ